MTHSLRGRLLIGLTLMIVLTGIGAGAVGFQWAFDEAIETQDSILTQIGALALKTRFHRLNHDTGERPFQNTDSFGAFFVLRAVAQIENPPPYIRANFRAIRLVFPQRGEP